MKNKLLIILIAVVIVMTGCQQSSQATRPSAQPSTTADATITNANYIRYPSPADIQSTADLGGDAARYYSKYIAYGVSGKDSIKILAQDKVGDEQLLYAHAILSLYLDNITAHYGENTKNTLAQSGAYLVMPNGRDTGSESAAIIGQPQYQLETANVGSAWYINNDYDQRDSTYEEIFHFVHMSGIGTVDNPQGSKALADKIAAAQKRALPADRAQWGIAGIWGLGARDSLEEWANEPGSLEAEYIISVIDTYYGNWAAADSSALFGEYKAKVRQDLSTIDPMGLEVIESFLPGQINVMMRVDPSFSGTFYMYERQDEPYTYKSQYLDFVSLTGLKNSNITANANDNVLIGNRGDNLIDGGEGRDVVQFSGLSDEYTISYQNGKTVVNDNEGRDGQDTLSGVEILRFKDRDVAVQP